MAYGELYKGTFRKYQENGTQATLSDNMRQTLDKMRHIKFEDFFNKTFSKIEMIQCKNGLEGPKNSSSSCKVTLTKLLYTYNELTAIFRTIGIK